MTMKTAHGVILASCSLHQNNTQTSLSAMTRKQCTTVHVDRLKIKVTSLAVAHILNFLVKTLVNMSHIIQLFGQILSSSGTWIQLWPKQLRPQSWNTD